jgi:hypothetical protein
MLKTNLLLSLLFCTVFLSLRCDKEDNLPECPNCDFTCIPQGEPDVVTNDCKNNFTCQFELHPDSKLDYSDENFDSYIKSGNNLVFRLYLHTDGAANVADDEFTDLLYFEIDPSAESFSAENDNLDLLNVRFQQLCFCADVKTKKPSSGCMQGQRIIGKYKRT